MISNSKLSPEKIFTPKGAVVAGSVEKALIAFLGRINPTVAVEYEGKKAAGLNAGIAKGEIEHTDKYIHRTIDPFLKTCQVLREKAGNTPVFLVIENLEHIVRNIKLVEQLALLILYLDDEKYSEYNVRLLIIGTPGDIRDYFSNVMDDQTIINRTQEIPEVSLLTDDQTISLFEKGFFELLKYTVKETEVFDADLLQFSIQWFSLNVPQYIHELCLDVAFEAQKCGGVITHEALNKGVDIWMRDDLIAEYSRLEKHLNTLETKKDRKNQVLYVMSQMNVNEFSSKEIEKELRRKLPNSTIGKK